MKGTRHSEEQIIAILKQGEAGLTTAELCRQHGITEQTYYRWKAKYGGMESGDAKKMKQLEDENRKLKHVVAELTLDKRGAEGRALKKLVAPAGLRAAVSYVEAEYEMSERHACRLMGLGRSTHRYRARRAERDTALRTRLKELAAPAHAVRISPAHGDAGARRNVGQSQAGVPVGFVFQPRHPVAAPVTERILVFCEETKNQSRTHIGIGTANGGTS
jgi:transposase-like protein